MQRLMEAARQRGVRRLEGAVLRENEGMLKLTEELGFTTRSTGEPSVVEVTLDLESQ
jgi:L-amino acid N-acyltransferase YncA